MHLLERHALYNLIRMNWLNDPQLKVEPWQVEDYRALSLDTLFERLRQFNIHLDRLHFIGYAEDYDAPEEFTESIIGDQKLEARQEDQIYLLIFELWRRLMASRPSLSILCNELDYQIYLHDTEQKTQSSQLQNALANFVLALNENVDQGLSAKEAFEMITPFFANDVESFLYDHIFELIEGNELYAQELFDNFAPYMEENKWFELLYIRLIEQANPKLSDKLLRHLMEDYLDQKDVSFNLDLIAFLIDAGKNSDFKSLTLSTLSILELEDDLQDLIMLCIDFYHRLDKEKQENELKLLLKKRSKQPLDRSIQSNDPDLAWLEKFLKS